MNESLKTLKLNLQMTKSRLDGTPLSQSSSPLATSWCSMNRNTRIVVCLGAFAIALAATSSARSDEKGIGDFPKLSAEQDWPWWRGPSRNGIADDVSVPTKLSDSQNVKWKVDIPGRGHSSPIVVGDRVFLTSANEKRKIHSILAFDRENGKQLWKVDVNQGGFPDKNHAKNTEATPTVASDGERLFATFYHHD
jgi:hypothetical protein